MDRQSVGVFEVYPASLTHDAGLDVLRLQLLRDGRTDELRHIGLLLARAVGVELLADQLKRRPPLTTLATRFRLTSRST